MKINVNKKVCKNTYNLKIENMSLNLCTKRTAPKNLKPILTLELTKTEGKKKGQPVITASKVYQVFLCSHIIACILPTSHFQISKHTLSFFVFKLKLLVSASLSLSITLSFKPHFTTSTNRWCHHSHPVNNIVPVLS